MHIMFQNSWNLVRSQTWQEEGRRAMHGFERIAWLNCSTGIPHGHCSTSDPTPPNAPARAVEDNLSTWALHPCGRSDRILSSWLHPDQAPAFVTTWGYKAAGGRALSLPHFLLPFLHLCLSKIINIIRKENSTVISRNTVAKPQWAFSIQMSEWLNFMIPYSSNSWLLSNHYLVQPTRRKTASYKKFQSSCDNYFTALIFEGVLW